MHVADLKPRVTGGTTSIEDTPPMPTRRLVVAGFVIILAGCASGSRNTQASPTWDRSAECLRTGGRWFVDSSGSDTCLYGGR
jgi:hypothetical protein